MQLCVTKPVLLESECSMRQGHMGFLPTSSLPSSPSLEYTLLQPARQNKWHRTQGLLLLNKLGVHCDTCGVVGAHGWRGPNAANTLDYYLCRC